MAASTAPFPNVPKTPHGHLGLLFYEAIYRVLHHVRGRALAGGKTLDDVFTEYPFLASYFAEIRPQLPPEINWTESMAWFRRANEAWENGTSEWLPLRSLLADLNLQRDSLMVLLLAGLVEEDARFATLFAGLQHPIPHRRPSVALLRDILLTGNGIHSVDLWDLCNPLIENGLVEVLNRETPRAEWILRMPLPLWSAARGEGSAHPLPASTLHAADDFPEIADLLVPEAQVQRLAALPPLLETGQLRVAVIRGIAGSDTLQVAGSLARALGLGVLEVQGLPAGSGPDDRKRVIGPLCLMRRTMPVFHVELNPGEVFEIPELPGHTGPVCVIAGREGGLHGPGLDRSVSLLLEPETPALRLRCWQEALDGREAIGLDRIARAFALPAKHIRTAAQMAIACAATEGRQHIAFEDVAKATQTLERQRLDTLATRLESGGSWSHLVVNQATLSDLQDLARRCRHRETLAGSMGETFPGGLNSGVRALLEGPSGTGKTLAARVLAAELGLDIYRVDLSALVNKYIGETEKNLSRVLNRAEELNVVLLLDEGDALMARRTDVKSSNDRYANLETNYLLQRLETYTGIALITTNSPGNIDPAFRRRMDVVVKFHLPDAEQRWQLWQLHLPPRHEVEAAEAEQIALRHAFTGGQIRNAAIYASLLALDRQAERVAAQDVRAAIEREYRKAGGVFPEHKHSGQSPHAGIASFLESIG